MKQRLDILLTEKGLAPSREKAKAMIMSGIVYVDGEKQEKPGMSFPSEAAIEVRGKTIPFVSRGGLKLEKALSVFGIDVSGLTCIDVGASTGGFTDCLLQNGAAAVTSIDVGYGQFDWKLRNDPRVTVMEKTNIRYVTPDMLSGPADFVCIDVSFISLTKVLPAVKALMKDTATLAALIKPQFEAGRADVGKHGVVRDPAVHEKVIRSVLTAAEELGFVFRGLSFSPVKGPEGNIEYLMYLARTGECTAADVHSVVEASHAELAKE